MTTGQDELGTDGERTRLRPAQPAKVRATSSNADRPSPDGHLVAATVTAELPTVSSRPGGSEGSPRETPRQGHGRETAPMAVRFAIWVLFFALIVVVTGAIVAGRDPGWLAFLRNTAPARSAARAGAPSPTSTPASRVAGGRIALVSSNPSSAIYSVPVSRYSVAVLSGTACYVEIKSPPSEQGYFYAAVVAPAKLPTPISVHGSVSVTLEAQAASLTVSSGGRSLGTIAHPKIAFTYIFRPSAA